MNKKAEELGLDNPKNTPDLIRENIENGIVREGAQVMLGANDSYKSLCRKHFKMGKLTGEEDVR